VELEENLVVKKLKESVVFLEEAYALYDDLQHVLHFSINILYEGSCTFTRERKLLVLIPVN